MSRFQGGPADGVTLTLRSAPLLLRVTFNPRAKTYPVLGKAAPPGPARWDALDQPEDEPAAHEQLLLYVRFSEPFFYHLSARGKGGRAMSGYWTDATYRYAELQPPDGVMRQPRPWQAFVAGYESETR